MAVAPPIPYQANGTSLVTAPFIGHLFKLVRRPLGPTRAALSVFTTRKGNSRPSRLRLKSHGSQPATQVFSRTKGAASCLELLNAKMEVVVGLEPTKTGFADRRLDHFGITTKKFCTQNLYPKLYPNCPKNAYLCRLGPSYPIETA